MTAPVTASTYVASRLGVPSACLPPVMTSHASRPVPDVASTTRRLDCAVRTTSWLATALLTAGVVETRMASSRVSLTPFKAPAAYPRDAVVSVGTHDLATLKGFWVGADLDAREALSPLPVPEHRYAQNVERTGQRRRLLHALQREALLPAGIDPYHATITDLAGRPHYILDPDDQPLRELL